MSGFGAPLRTATPAPEFASAALVAATSLTCRRRSSMAAVVSTARSNVAPSRYGLQRNGSAQDERELVLRCNFPPYQSPHAERRGVEREAGLAPTMRSKTGAAAATTCFTPYQPPTAYQYCLRNRVPVGNGPAVAAACGRISCSAKFIGFSRSLRLSRPRQAFWRPAPMRALGEVLARVAADHARSRRRHRRRPCRRHLRSSVP